MLVAGVTPHTTPPRRANRRFFPNSMRSFQLLGFDVMFSCDYNKCWLLEANCDPSLSTKTFVDRLLKKKLLSQTFQLLGVLDQFGCHQVSQIVEDELLLMEESEGEGGLSGGGPGGFGGGLDAGISPTISERPGNYFRTQNLSGTQAVKEQARVRLREYLLENPQLDVSSSEFTEKEDSERIVRGSAWPQDTRVITACPPGPFVTENFVQLLPIQANVHGERAFLTAERIHEIAKENAMRWLEFSAEHMYDEEEENGNGGNENGGNANVGGGGNGGSGANGGGEKGPKGEHKNKTKAGGIGGDHREERGGGGGRRVDGERRGR